MSGAREGGSSPDDRADHPGQSKPCPMNDIIPSSISNSLLLADYDLD